MANFALMFSLKDIRESNFESTALEIFQLQADKVKVYREYLSLLKVKPSEVKTIQQIPFLPIHLFKSRQIIADDMQEEAVFSSSGTTRASQSRHYVADITLYEVSF